MKAIVLYLIGHLVALGLLLGFLHSAYAPQISESVRLLVSCVAVGGLGGAVYCLRAVYVNACVKQRWNDEWKPWYYIRPVVSLVCGGISFIFLKAGLLVLEAKQSAGATNLGFLALAFIAGLNVSRFVEKMEDIAQASWGIKRSRMSSGESRNENTDL